MSVGIVPRFVLVAALLGHQITRAYVLLGLYQVDKVGDRKGVWHFEVRRNLHIFAAGN